MKFEFNQFTGMMPRLDERQLPKGAAVDAQNIEFDAGAVKGAEAPVIVVNVSESTKFIGKHHGAWLNSVDDVFVVDSIRPQDEGIIYYCSKTQALSSQDVIANPNIGVGATPLGVAVPEFPLVTQYPTANIDFSDPATPATGEVIKGEFSISGGFANETNDVALIPASVYEGAVVNWAGGSVKLLNVTEKAKTASAFADHWTYETSYEGGDGSAVTYQTGTSMADFPDSADTITDVVFNQENAERFNIAITNVKDGLESAPYIRTDSITRQKDNSLRVDRGTTYIGTHSSRIYEDTGNGFLFVGEIAVADQYGFINAGPYRNYGGEITSTLNDEPITGMHSLISLPNAVLAGAYKNLLCVSRPGLPHAWPSLWQVNVDGEIIGLGKLHNAIIVLTARGAWIANAYDPSAINLEVTNAEFGAVSRRSIVSHSSGVYYAAIDGLWRITSRGAENLTIGTIDKDQWSALQPSTFYAVINHGYYIARRGVLNDLIKVNLSDFSYTVEAL